MGLKGGRWQRQSICSDPHIILTANQIWDLESTPFMLRGPEKTEAIIYNNGM